MATKKKKGRLAYYGRLCPGPTRSYNRLIPCCVIRKRKDKGCHDSFKPLNRDMMRRRQGNRWMVALRHIGSTSFAFEAADRLAPASLSSSHSDKGRTKRGQWLAGWPVCVCSTTYRTDEWQLQGQWHVAAPDGWADLTSASPESRASKTKLSLSAHQTRLSLS
ncbi:hypothetical protein BD289DRAFT_277684 [Coniella lustricola]|uniref:Uncharacterized protein n=1 Tax=Coniella lustricola TaxID=2025994 RepID=A0A2T3A6I8_9PEZI|nr:hypothetical protein BD289DRAFT_277684 [Coniella lustricola]